MQLKVFDTTLTQGQLIWVLSHGQFRAKAQFGRVAADIRYLRALGVPFEEAKRGRGRGNRLTYDFEEFTELCIAVAALRRGLRPKEVAAYMIKHRKDLRSQCRKILEALPAAALETPAAPTRKRVVALRADEQFLRLHDRYSQTPGKYEVIGLDEAEELEDVMGMKEVFPDGAVRPLIPLTRLLMELAALAPKAPVVRPGPG